ncbi:MAG TPA: TolC family protein, partial [Synergistales bacterium]|nr:TolC family protein [Synergistales bacterium]
MKKRIMVLTLFILLFFCNGAFSLENQDGEIRSLDLDACIDLSMANHPDLKAAEGEVKGADSLIGQVEAGLKPQVDLSSSYTRQEAASQGDHDQYSSSVSLSQLVSDWGKTGSRKKIAGLGRDRSSLDLDQVRLTVKYNVQKAYYSLLKARKSLEVAEESVGLYELHLK